MNAPHSAMGHGSSSHFDGTPPTDLNKFRLQNSEPDQVIGRERMKQLEAPSFKEAMLSVPRDVWNLFITSFKK